MMMKVISKMVEDKVNTEDFIYEIEKRPAIWDTCCEGYGNKVEKRKAWQEIIANFIPEFEDRPLAERNEVVTMIQKKWKGIRSCYSRELLRKRKEKSGTGATGRKQYVHFEILRFLETVCKQTASTKDEDTSLENENENAQDISCEIQTKETGVAKEQRHNQSRKRKNSDDDELDEVLKTRIVEESQQASLDNDEDRLFLLSLVSELRKVPVDRKLKLKSDIIAAISQAQQVCQAATAHTVSSTSYFSPISITLCPASNISWKSSEPTSSK